MSPEDLNQDGKIFLQRLIDDERNWVLKALTCIRHNFVDADIWTTGGVDSKYIDIRVGVKKPGKIKGRPLLYLQKIAGSKARLSLNSDYREGAGIAATIDMSTSEGDVALNAWLKKLKLHLSEWPEAMNGDGNVPVKYRISEINKTEPDGTGLPPSVYDARIIPLNQILYGPPGTGKTFNTVTAAMEIVSPESVQNYNERDTQSRRNLQTAFQQYLQSGQIVFCTFHQSFSYEDFVEGLRATSEQGQLQYAVESGIFKQLCERAKLGTTAAEDPFDKAIALLAELCSDPEARPVLSTRTGKKFEVEYKGSKTFRVFPKESTVHDANYVANIELVRKLYQGHEKKGMYNPSYVEGMLNYLKEKCGLPTYRQSQSTAQERRNFVIIIDEINRGNVSRILGELITLIEPGKRAGNAEELSVVLPYSKERFNIPSNVYIIGTMNTADRSLVGLDIALRRRFAFTEMAPNPDRLSNLNIGTLNIGKLLRVINQRIEVLLDREHCIGHAYFLVLNEQSDLVDLAYIFDHQIIPLLQEYFFEDWERISWVLNDQNKPDPAHRFIVEPTQADESVEVLFGKGAEALKNKRWRLNRGAFVLEQSFIGIMPASKA